ncbi:putative serine protease HhoA precursor [compost metagenome]
MNNMKLGVLSCLATIGFLMSNGLAYATTPTQSIKSEVKTKEQKQKVNFSLDYWSKVSSNSNITDEWLVPAASTSESVFYIEVEVSEPFITLPKIGSSEVIKVYVDMTSTGSGFLVANNIVVTAAHLVTNDEGNYDSNKPIKLKSSKADTTTIAGKLVFVDKEKDIAFIQLEDCLGIQPFELQDKTADKENVLALGYPVSLKNKGVLSKVRPMATVSNLASEYFYYKAGDKTLDYKKIEVALESGYSGGPVINFSKSVVGFVIALATDNKVVIVPSSVIKDSLESYQSSKTGNNKQ